MGTAGSCDGGSLLGQNLCWKQCYLCHALPLLTDVYEFEHLPAAGCDCCSNSSRVCRLLFASLQHHAFYLLQHQRSVLLRQPQRQVLLALHHCSHPHDASGQRADPPVHQPLLRLWSTLPGCGRAQPGYHHPPVSPWLAQPLDRILLPHGKDSTANGKCSFKRGWISSLRFGHWDRILWVACRKLYTGLSCSFKSSSKTKSVVLHCHRYLYLKPFNAETPIKLQHCLNPLSTGTVFYCALLEAHQCEVVGRLSQHYCLPVFPWQADFLYSRAVCSAWVPSFASLPLAPTPNPVTGSQGIKLVARFTPFSNRTWVTALFTSFSDPLNSFK